MSEENEKPEYDMSIHDNPDAAAWARFFKSTCDKLGKECDEAWMLSRFANAMMAMHDFTVRKHEAELASLRALVTARGA